MQQISKYLEKWGRFHTILHMMSFIACAFNAMQTLVFSFTLANPNTRCMYENETDVSYDSVFGETQWHRLFDGNDTQGGKDIYCSYCPSMVVDGTILPGQCGVNYTSETCSAFVYDKSQYHTSMAMTYDMVCPSGVWKVQVAESLYMVGVLIGAALWGSLADHIGRRKTYIICSILFIIASNVQPFSPNYIVVCIFQVLIGCFGNGPYLVMFIIIMEYSGPSVRSAAGMIYQSYFSVGSLLVGLFAYYIRDWVWLMHACSFPLVLLIPTFFIFPESYMWLASQGRIEEAKREIQNVCKRNNVTIPEDILDAELKNEAGNKQDNSATIVDLFRHWVLAKNTLISFFMWFAVSMGYYGLALNASDLPGSDYSNFVLLAAVEIPAYLITIPIMNKIGRVRCMYGSMCIGGTTLIVSTFLPATSLAWLITILALIGKMCIASAFCVAYNYAAELFPTVVRSTGTGFCSMFARVGSISAPQIHLLANYVDTWLPMVIYGGFSFAAGFLDFFLPETLGKVMPQTIDDGIHFTDKDYNQRRMSPETLDDDSSNGDVQSIATIDTEIISMKEAPKYDSF